MRILFKIAFLGVMGAHAVLAHGQPRPTPTPSPTPTVRLTHYQSDEQDYIGMSLMMPVNPDKVERISIPDCLIDIVEPPFFGESRISGRLKVTVIGYIVEDRRRYCQDFTRSGFSWLSSIADGQIEVTVQPFGDRTRKITAAKTVRGNNAYSETTRVFIQGNRTWVITVQYSRADTAAQTLATQLLDETNLRLRNARP